ncbi:hypothetical protein [Streptomyces sp. IBSBF 3010]|uniref:hypothetical protein n=1 Tax=Streptomyces sp. IBSBF 3010 TaxID=2903526 RepID=UPI003FA790FC
MFTPDQLAGLTEADGAQLTEDFRSEYGLSEPTAVQAVHLFLTIAAVMPGKQAAQQEFERAGAAPRTRRRPRTVTTMRIRTACLLAAVPVTVAVATLKASHVRLHADRRHIALQPRPRRSCPDCRGAGGWWTGGPFPEMEACGCWSERRELRIPFRAAPPWPEEPPF